MQHRRCGLLPGACGDEAKDSDKHGGAGDRHLLAVLSMRRGYKRERARRYASTFCITVIPFKKDRCKKKKMRTMGSVVITDAAIKKCQVVPPSWPW